MLDSIEKSRKRVEHVAETNRVTAWFLFDASLPVFEGHFPGQPVLPAIFQIEMVRNVIATARKTAYAIDQVTKAKIMRPIRPGEEVTLELTYNDIDGKVNVNARISATGEPAAIILLVLRCRHVVCRSS